MQTHPPAVARRLGRARAAGVAALCSAVLATAACSGDTEDEQPEPSAGGGTTAPAPAAVALTARPGQLAGRLPAADRKEAVTAVGTVVDGWLDAAYVGGAYPRTDFSGAFPGFTKGAAADADKDAGLLSNKSVGGQIESVTVDRKAASVDLVATDEKAVGATARVRLLFTTSGPYAKQVRVIGRLFLSPVKGGSWKVFGYQIRKAEL